MSVGFAELTVAAVERLCADAAAVTFAVPPEQQERFAFRPGQSLTVRRAVDGRDERRNYSICSPAGAAPRIGVREVAGGAVSGWLVHDLAAGESVQVAPPTGTFTPDLDEPARHVLVAAGSGITPMISIATSVLAADGASTVSLIYANRRTDSVMFVDELAELKDRHPGRFELLHVLSREPGEADVLSGRLDAERLTRLLDALVPVAAVDHWWLCGPFGLTETARQVLRGRGVASQRVHRELFYVEDDAPPPARHVDAAPDGPLARVTVLLDGRTTELALPRDVPVLDAAQRVRSDLPFACKGGVCGTCRARLVDGRVHMRRNFALEQAELDAGFVLTCQSLPDSDELRLDYDA